MLSTNRDRAIALLIDRGPMHRADMARLLGVSRTTVTNLVKGLFEHGIIEPDGHGGEEGGYGGELVRPDGAVQLKEQLVISRRIGLIGVAVHLADRTIAAIAAMDGKLISVASQDCAASTPGADRLDSAVAMLRELMADPAVQGIELRALHLSVNTQCDRDSGEVLGGEASALWRGVNPKRRLESEFGVPVAIENTVRLLGFAQYFAKPGLEARNLVYVHLAHGVAMGHVLNGAIAGGSHGGAGELGHLSIDRDGRPCACSNRGCLMQYVGLGALEDQVHAVLGAEARIADAVSAAADNSHACIGIISQAGSTIGEALTAVCNLLDPDVVVVGGELAAAGDVLLEPIRLELSRRALPLVTRNLHVLTAQPLDDRTLAEVGVECLRRDVEFVTSVVVGLRHPTSSDRILA